MRLADALRLAPGRVVAFTGAGGKTSAIRRLADELAGELPLLVTTTTKLALAQSSLAAMHVVIQDSSAFPDLIEDMRRSPSVLVTGPQAAGEPKWLAPSPAFIKRLVDLAREVGAALLIEADGARGRSLKAPAEHEPVIPREADLVVPVVGLDVIGRPLEERWVQRPERVARLLGLGPGEPILPESVARLLASDEAGLRGVPPAAEVRVLLNKAESAESKLAGKAIAEAVLDNPRVRAVVMGSVQWDPPIGLAFGRVAGVVLAAGGSTRLRQSKQLLLWDGKPLVWHAVQAARRARLTPIVVVVGADGERVARAVEGDALILQNPAWEEGQSSSLRAGLRAAVTGGAEAAVFLLSDMPHVTEDLVRALVEEHRSTLAPVVAPASQGRRGNPVLFDRVTFTALEAVRGDLGGRAIFDHFPVHEIPWDAKDFVDIDTPLDLKDLHSDR